MQLYLPSGQTVTPPRTPVTWVEQATGVDGDPIRMGAIELDVSGAVAFHRQRPFFQGVTNVGQSIVTSTWTPMPMAEIVDNVGGHSDATNTSRWAAPQTANANDWYLVIGYVPMISTNTTNVHAAGIRVNGGTPFEGMMLTSGAHNVSPMVVDLVQLASGDYVELVGWQNTGGPITTVSSAESPNLSVRWACSGSGTTVALPSAPRTWTGTDALTADSTGGAKVPLNLNIRDLIRYLNYPPVARLNSTGTTQAITSGTGWTSVQMTAEDIDNYGGHDNVTNNTRYTCQRAGLYLIAGQVSLTEINPAIGYRASRLLHTIAAGGTAVYPGTTTMPPSAANTGTHMVAVHLVRMAVGDYVEMQVSHTQTANMSVKSAASSASKLIAVWKSL